MLGNLKTIISQAQSELPDAGIVGYDCNQHDVFYIPQSQLDEFKEKLSHDDCIRFETANAEYSDNENILVVTFHNNKVIGITTYDEKEHFAHVCPLELAEV